MQFPLYNMSLVFAFNLYLLFALCGVWSGFTPFAQGCLSQYLEYVRKIHYDEVPKLIIFYY